MQHLLILDYRTDAERKRIDYTIEKWSAKKEISVVKPRGVVVMVEGANLDEFVEDVYSRMDAGAEPPKVYAVEEKSPAVEKNVKHLSFHTSQSADNVENFIRYLLTKQNAVFEYADGTRKIYSARTRKGQVQVTTDITTDKTVRCQVTVEGYGDGVDFIAARIQDEMNVFLGGAGP